jgi:hypothetical protein
MVGLDSADRNVLLVEFCEVNDNPSDVTKPWTFKTFQYKVGTNNIF